MPETARRAYSLVEAIVALAIIGLLIGLLLPAVQRMRTSAQRAQCANKLRQIGLALHHHHSDAGALPPGMSLRADEGRYRYLSWHARLLPYAEQSELWQRAQAAYRVSLPFARQDPHSVLGMPLDLYYCPTDPRDNRAVPYEHFIVAYTWYLGVSGSHATATDGVLYPDSKVRLTDIVDGTSNTIAAGERPPSSYGDFGWWYAGLGQDGTGSGDMILSVAETNRGRSFAQLSPCPRGPYEFRRGSIDDPCDTFHFWSHHASGAHFLFADGSVRMLNYSVSALLPALASRDGGEPSDIPD